MSFFDHELLAAHFDDIAYAQLPASSGFDLAVYLDFAVLDRELGLSPGSRQGVQLQEVIEPKCIVPAPTMKIASRYLEAVFVRPMRFAFVVRLLHFLRHLQYLEQSDGLVQAANRVCKRRRFANVANAEIPVGLLIVLGFPLGL